MVISPFLILALVGLYLASKVISFGRHYVHGRRSGYPVVVSPVFSRSIAFMILGPALQPLFKKCLPEWIYLRLDIVTHGWEFRRKAEIHRRFGKVFALVTPDECSLWVADHAVGNVILQRRKDFVMPSLVESILGVFGPNIVCSNDDEWQRQRRVVAPNLNERISKTVWSESCQQAQAMIDYLKKNPGSETLSGLRCLAINVIGATGYGHNQAWFPDMQALSQGWSDVRGAYFKTISLVADALLEAAFLPPKFMKLPFMPAYVQLLGQHKEKMPEYTKNVLDNERLAAKNGTAASGTFLSMLVRFSDNEKSSGSSGLFLSDKEISGNLFVFTTAGFDTTANTMAYAVMLLAAYPEWETWVRDNLVSLDPDTSTWKYEEVFPRCRRVLALMFETLRLYSPVAHSTRSVSAPQQIVDDNGSHLLLPPMEIYVSTQSIHCNPEYWGIDAVEFRPSRWIDDNGDLIAPLKGTFLPWSGGPRVCPGMKMAQVEFVATITSLFRSARCEPIANGSETLEDSRKRLIRIMDDSIPKLTLQIKDPTQVKLRWIPHP